MAYAQITAFLEQSTCLLAESGNFASSVCDPEYCIGQHHVYRDWSYLLLHPQTVSGLCHDQSRQVGEQFQMLTCWASLIEQQLGPKWMIYTVHLDKNFLNQSFNGPQSALHVAGWYLYRLQMVSVGKSHFCSQQTSKHSLTASDSTWLNPPFH